MKETKKPRGHAPENVEVNQAIIALWICGFSQWSISRLLHKDRWNVQKYLLKYRSKYLRLTYHNIVDLVSDVMLKEKRNGRQKHTKRSKTLID